MQVFVADLAAESARKIEHALLVIVSPTRPVPNEPSIPNGHITQFAFMVLAKAQRQLVVRKTDRQRLGCDLLHISQGLLWQLQDLT